MTPSTVTQRRSGFGLGQRLALFVGFALTMAIGVVAAIVFAGQVRATQAAFAETGARATNLLSRTLGGAVRFAKTENIDPALTDFIAGQETDIAWMAVVDPTGRPITSRALHGAPDAATLAEAMTRVASSGDDVRLDGVTAAPVRFGPEDAIVGGLIVSWSDERVLAGARATAVRLALTGAGLAALFSVIAYLVISRLVSAPIGRLDASLKALAAGRFDTQAPGQGRGDEIGTMARNIERLRAALAEAEAQRARMTEMEAAAVAARESMLHALRQGVGSVVGAARNGDFARRVDQRFDDETLQGLADGVNAICDVISRFLDDGERALKALARGDLSQAMPATYTGRFDGFACALNTTLDGLTSLVAQLQETHARISETVEEISRDSDALSERAVAQATALQQTSATMVELSTTIRTNADNAASSADAVGDARGQADASRDLIGRAVAAMKDIQSGTNEITEIVNAIDGFAFQTNLLALNAAVEAARAGDAGKGFAVVASEVRTLAQRAAEAAKDIRRLIAASQSNVEKGAAVVDATGAALFDILASFVAIAPAMQDISNATREQSTGVGELTSTLTEIDDATQMTAHLAERGAMRAQTLRDQSQALAELIAFFDPRQAEAYAPSRAAE